MAQEDKKPDLAEIDPIFGAPIGMQGAVTTPKAQPKEAVNPETAGLVGAGVGFMAPKLEPIKTATGITQAQANLAGTKAASTTAQKQMLERAGVFDQRMANLQKSLAAAQATHGENMTAYQIARENLIRAGLPLEEHPTLAQASGDVWSKKVVGSMGPGGESVTEAARNYQMQKGLTPGEASKFTVGRSGIIEPNTKMPATAVSRENALLQFKQAEEKALASASELAKNQGLFQSLTAKGPVSNQFNEKVLNLQAKVAEQEAKLAELQKLSKGTMAAKIFGKIPGVASGAMSGYELAKAYNALKAGQPGEAILPALSGVGGALMMVPSLPTKAVGAALAFPPLAYEAYKAYTEPDQPPPPTMAPLQ